MAEHDEPTRPPDEPMRTIGPEVFAVEDVVACSCGIGAPVEHPDVLVRTVHVSLLGGPVAIHSGEPSVRVELLLSEWGARKLRMALDHDDCPPHPAVTP